MLVGLAAVGAVQACGAPQLTVVNQPITCDCPWETSVFSGELRGGTASGAPLTVRVLVESKPGRSRVSFVVPNRGPLCTLTASGGPSLDPDQECIDPGSPDTTIRITTGEWIETEAGSRLRVTYAWTESPNGPHGAATFAGAIVALPPAPHDPLRVCGGSGAQAFVAANGVDAAAAIKR
jgi:hypothetical protein